MRLLRFIAGFLTGSVLVQGAFWYHESRLHFRKMYDDYDPRADTWILDPSTGMAHKTGSLSGPRLGHVAVLLPGSRVMVLGGQLGGYRGDLTATCEIWSPETDRWEQAPPLPRSLNDLTAVALADGSVVCTGWDEGAYRMVLDSGAGSWRSELLDDGLQLLLEDGTVLCGSSRRLWPLWHQGDEERFAPAMIDTGKQGKGILLAGGEALFIRERDTGPDDLVVWDSRTGRVQELGMLPHPGGVSHVREFRALTDGRAFVLMSLPVINDLAAWVIDPGTGERIELPRLKGRVWGTCSFAPSPDGGILLSDRHSWRRCRPGMRWWRELGEPREMARTDYSATILDDGRILVTGGGTWKPGPYAQRDYDKVWKRASTLLGAGALGIVVLLLTGWGVLGSRKPRSFGARRLRSSGAAFYGFWVGLVSGCVIDVLGLLAAVRVGMRIPH